uniref:Uncharacterized protein n=1 Tax=Oryza brachyantha TaxID=4533 RepID=J3LCJ7_ORYBR
RKKLGCGQSKRRKTRKRKAIAKGGDSKCHHLNGYHLPPLPIFQSKSRNRSNNESYELFRSVPVRNCSTSSLIDPIDSERNLQAGR